MSLFEIILIFVVALIVFGPEKLPELARNLGKFAAEFRKMSDGVRREFYNSAYPPAPENPFRLSDIERELRTIKSEILAPPGPGPETGPVAEAAPAAKVEVTEEVKPSRGPAET